MIKQILENGYGYEKNGSVYFDVEKYNQDNNYGKLSGRKIEDILENTRSLDGQSDKKHSADFALWKKAMPEHIMRWPSPWGDGFPGWHLECSAMSTKYLGEQFDIHGGGMDLLFPHHECEIAQNIASKGIEPVKYWMHNNMITINGKKMGKSLGNFITLDELFTGTHKLVEHPYPPMTIRFFILQAHYRSTVDFSNTALQAAEKGLKRLLAGAKTLQRLNYSESSSIDLSKIKPSVFNALNDDFNSPIAIANLFDAVKVINSVNDGKETISQNDLIDLQQLFTDVVYTILGLKEDNLDSNDDTELVKGLMETIIDTRKELKARKEFELTDQIRDNLAKYNVQIKDTREGIVWKHEQ